MIFIEKALTDKFYEIIAKHNNARWSVNELEYLVYDKHRAEYDALSKEDQFIVDNVFKAYRNLHGAKLPTDL